MAAVEKRPFWFDHFKRLVEKCWDHHGPCKTFHLQSALQVENGLWLFRAAPVFQEIFGGKDDGKTVWTKFEFHTDKLTRALKVYRISTTSGPPAPSVTIHAEYRSHMVQLTVHLQPPPGSPVVEIVDTLKHEVRTR
jgi:hypothetical protein